MVTIWFHNPPLLRTFTTGFRSLIGVSYGGQISRKKFLSQGYLDSAGEEALK
jgi:hypothetical protein